MACRIYKHHANGKSAPYHVMTPTAAAKARARQAWQACRADPQLSLLDERVWAETLQQVAGVRDAPRVETMFTGTAIMREIMINRRGWPAVVRGLPRL